MEIILKAIRAFFANIDSHLYYLIKVVYNLIVDLANVKLFSDTTLNDFATRVYTLLGIFMLFKVTFSFITYIINPDTMTDKTSGVQNIIKNVIISLVMIIVAPRAFDLLYEAQSAILDDNILPKFILGTEGDMNSTSDLSLYMYTYESGSNSEGDLNSNPCEGKGDGIFIAASQADYINLMILRNFFKPETDMAESDLKESLNRTDGGPKNYCNPTNSIDSLDSNIPNKVTAGSFLDNSNIFNSYKYGNNFAINYSLLISTIVPAVVLLIYISIAFDIAVRAIKLSFLQLIAPIPIISYIDPNSGKNGMFKKWLTEVGKTWANLFIRLASVYFAVYVIQQISNSNFPMFYNESYKPKSGTFWIQLFIIIGALMFAKQLPKLLETLIPGLNMSGSLQLNPFKKVRDEAIGGKLITGAATGMAAGGLALAGGMAANSWNIGKNLNKNRKDLGGWKEGLQRTLLGTDSEGNTRKFRNGETGIKGVLAGANSLRIGFGNSAGSIIGGGVSSGARSLVKAKDGTWHPLKNAGSGIAESSSRRNQRDDGIGIKEKTAEKVTSIAGIKNDYGLYGKNSDRIKNLKNQEAEFNTYEEISRKAQMEYLANSRHTAGTFTPAFSRDEAGLGEREYNAKDENKNYVYSGADEYSRYQDYMNKLNAQRTSRGEQAFDVLMQYEFDQYDRLETNTHYYNVEHQRVKKELSKAENLFKKNDK